jgi:hypothetical protein
MLGKEDLARAVFGDGALSKTVFGSNGTKEVVPSQRVRILFYPRGVYPDEGAGVFYVVLACTYCDVEHRWPMLVRKDQATGEIRYLLGNRNVRQIETRDLGLIFAPWVNEYFFELSKSDLSILRRIPKPRDALIHWDVWDPFSLVKDASANRVYITTEFYPYVLRYDLDSGRLEKILDLVDSGIVRPGALPWCMVQSEKSRRLYIIVTSGKYDLIEVDPDSMRMVRGLSLHDFLGSYLAIDDEKGLLYYQHGMFDGLYCINLKTFQVERKYRGEYQARALAIDKRRNVIYVLGYLTGKVFPVDLESGRRMWEMNVGGRPEGMALSGDKLWINSIAGTFRVDLQTIWKHYGYGGTRFDLDAHN